MTSFFPDLNVWLALSDTGHSHATHAWHWLNQFPEGAMLLFSRYTQVGLLRLLTNNAVMRQYTLTVKDAWEIYDRWYGQDIDTCTGARANASHIQVRMVSPSVNQVRASVYDRRPAATLWRLTCVAMSGEQIMKRLIALVFLAGASMAVLQPLMAQVVVARPYHRHHRRHHHRAVVVVRP